MSERKFTYLDKTTDIYTWFELSLIVRIIKNGVVFNHFLDLFQLPRADAEIMTIDAFLQKESIDIKTCIFQWWMGAPQWLVITRALNITLETLPHIFLTYIPEIIDLLCILLTWFHSIKSSKNLISFCPIYFFQWKTAVLNKVYLWRSAKHL